MLHRLRYAFEHPAFKQIVGEMPIEIDETFIGGLEKNKHTKKKTKGVQGRSVETKTPVLGIKERGGNIVAMVVPDTSRISIRPIIENIVKKGAIVCTDEWKAYNGLQVDYEHMRVNHGEKEYVNNMASTNGVENFWSHLKRGIDGIYHWVSVPHLQRYVTEFSLRYNTRKVSTNYRFNLILSNLAGRLTYEQLISHE